MLDRLDRQRPASVTRPRWRAPGAARPAAVLPRLSLPRLSLLRLSLLHLSLLSLSLLYAQAQAQPAMQWSGSVSLLSDYRYRGQSLNDGKPAAQAGINLDGADGWYLGGMTSNAHFGGIASTQLLAYAGYARRLASGWSVEAGATDSRFGNWHVGDYKEVYLGAAGERLSARLYYAPHYFGRDARTAYAELNGFYPLDERVNLVAHAGWMRTLSGSAWPGIPASSRYDVRLGVGVPLGSWSLQLAWLAAQSNTENNPRYEERAPRTWVLSASWAF